MELWQLYDSVGNETGKIIEANSEIPEGLYHKTVSVWIKNKKEQYLMSKRSPEKQYAYCWECTGGSVQAGENTWEAACREVYEELGIDISSLTGKKLISKKRKEQKDFYDVWIVYGEFGLHELSPNKTEVLNLSFVIENPIERVCYLPSRKTNIVFNFAEALWYLSGKNDLDFIEYYASNMRKYSMDGKCLTGTAYGKKIFQYGDKKINQWNRLLDVFKEDRDSKRGFIGIFNPNEILTLENIDVSCTIGLQFFIRNSKLFMSTFMRANDAYRGILSDVFSFTFIQEMLATQMGLEVGSYCHNVATTHIYEPDNKMVEKVLSDTTKEKELFSFPCMPKKNNWDDLKEVYKYEKLYRTHEEEFKVDDVLNLNIAEYWKQVILLLGLFADIKRKNHIDKEAFENLLPIYQYFVKNKWDKFFDRKE